MIPSKTPETDLVDSILCGANLSGVIVWGFKASVAVEESGIRSLQDVPLEEVSNSPLWYPLACSEDGPHDRVTNTYMRCKHEVQLVSELNEPGLACGPSSLTDFCRKRRK